MSSNGAQHLFELWSLKIHLGHRLPLITAKQVVETDHLSWARLKWIKMAPSFDCASKTHALK